MSKKTSYLLGILLTILVGSFLYYKFCCSICCDGDACKKKKEVVEEKEDLVSQPLQATSFPFSIKDSNGNFSFSVDENFNFKKSNYRILDSLSSSINDGIINISSYLGTDATKRFNITGLYASDEVNNSAFPNLGLARANSVKNYMVSQGMSSKLINIFGKLDDSLVADPNDVLFGPISYDIFTRTDDSAASDEALKQACEAIKENPLMLYFKTGEAHINLTSEQREKFVAISRCIDKLGATVNVVGHTDNTGDAEANMLLGQQRANFVKDYLVQNGILAQFVEATSKGQNEPIADNATPEGRAKNRRIVVTIN